MKAFRRLLFVWLFAALAGPSNALTASEFSCIDLLQNLGFAGMIAPGENRLEMRFAGRVPGSADPISVNENLQLNQPFVLLSDFDDLQSDGSNEVLFCALMVVEFHDSQTTANKLLFGDDYTYYRAPVLLVGTFQTVGNAQSRYNNWSKKRHMVQTIYKPGLDPQTQTVNLTSERFYEPHFLNLWQGTGDALRVVSADITDENVKYFLTSADVGTDKVLVLCGQQSCDQLARRLLTLVTAAGTSTESTVDATSTSGVTGSSTGDSTQTLNFVTPPNAGAGPEGTSSEGAGGATTGASPPPEKSQPYEIVTKIEDRDGDSSFSLLTQIDQFECLLLALDANVFAELPDCGNAQSAMDEIASLDAAIKIQPDGDWHIVEGARFQSPERIELVMPLGVDTNSCGFDLTYTSADQKSVTLELDYVGRSDPAVFVANVDGAMQIRQGKVDFEIVEVQASEQCPFLDTTYSVDAQRSVRVSFDVVGQTSAGIVQVLVLHSDDMDIHLRLGSEHAGAFAKGTATAVESAHLRTSILQDGPSALSWARIAMLDSRGQLEQLKTLDSEDLRGRVEGAFDEIPVGAVNRLYNNKANLSADTLAQALQATVEEAKELGLSTLHIAILGHVEEGAAGATDLCTSRMLNSASERLNALDGPDIRLALFVTHRANRDQRIVDEMLRPMGYNAAGAALGGAYKCLNTPSGIDIFPYIIEAWRPGVDVAPRYAAALSDQMALYLESMIDVDGGRP